MKGCGLIEKKLLSCLTVDYQQFNDIMGIFQTKHMVVHHLIVTKVLETLETKKLVRRKDVLYWALMDNKRKEYVFIDCMTQLPKYEENAIKASKKRKVIGFGTKDLTHVFKERKNCKYISVERVRDEKKLNKIIELQMMSTATQICEKTQKEVFFEFISSNNCVDSIKYILESKYDRVSFK